MYIDNRDGDYMDNLILYIIIGVVVVLLIVIIAIVVGKKKKKKNSEKPASILDVQNIGVSTNNQEFSYGYEKEATIVMDPVDPNVSAQANISAAVLNVPTPNSEGDKSELNGTVPADLNVIKEQEAKMETENQSDELSMPEGFITDNVSQETEVMPADFMNSENNSNNQTNENNQLGSIGEEESI